MARTTKREIGWPDAEGNEYRVTLSCTPGSPGRYYGEPGDCYPPEGPEMEVVSVREDRPGGAERPDLIPVVSAELDGPWGDRAADQAEDAQRDAYNDEMERRSDACGEARMLGGRP